MTKPESRPEQFLFSVVDGEETLVVRIIATSGDAALARFRAMSGGERRRHAISRSGGRDPDQITVMSRMIERLLPRVRRGLRAAG